MLYRARLVYAFSIIRLLCSLYSLVIIYVKFKYRRVIGDGSVIGSISRDILQIIFALLPIFMGYAIQNSLNLSDLNVISADLH